MLIANNGNRFAFDLAIEPLFDADGSVIGITGAAMDIARLRELTDRLQDAKDKLANEKSYLESEIQSELGFEEIIGQSPALRDVLNNVRVVAPTDSTVLLLGETGTGKELVARSVHALSPRHDKTFVKLNCAAVPSGLLESELFGHEKGAFTGAVSQKVGRIELADKGTLFLDEIGELPLELQPKLLRVLQDREFERLGGVHTLHVDVRIISATNRDLHQDIADRMFREDLFYRLNVFPIELPALRERRTDIPILVHHFVRKHAARMGKQIDEVPEETMKVLQNWNWPGNIRELENMIERMVILSNGRVLAPPPVELDALQDVGDDNLTEMAREHIIRVLRETNGVLSGTDGAASRLGLKRTTLQSMLKRHGIELQEYRRGSGAFGRQVRIRSIRRSDHSQSILKEDQRSPPSREKREKGGAARLLASLCEAVVLLQDFAEPVVRQGDYGVIVDAGHGFGGDHGVDDGFFGGLDCRQKNGIERIVGEHGELVESLGADGAGIRGGEGDEDVTRAVAGVTSVASQAERDLSWRCA